MLFGDFRESFDDYWVVGGAVSHGRAAAEGDRAVLGGVKARGIGGVGDIEADADIREDPVGGHHGAVATDFFLDGIEADERVIGFLFLLGDAAHDLGDDVAADAVIEGAGDEAFVGEFGGAIGVDGEVADAQAEFGDFGGGGCADIDPELVNFWGFFIAEILAEVDGGVADDAEDLAAVAEDAEAAATGGGMVGAADAVEPEEAFVVDVFDHPADFVGVRSEHHAALGFPGEGGPSRAVGVAFDGVGGGFQVFGPDALAGHFAAGWAWGFEQVVEEFAVVLGHGG